MEVLATHTAASVEAVQVGSVDVATSAMVVMEVMVVLAEDNTEDSEDTVVMAEPAVIMADIAEVVVRIMAEPAVVMADIAAVVVHIMEVVEVDVEVDAMEVVEVDVEVDATSSQTNTAATTTRIQETTTDSANPTHVSDHRFVKDSENLSALTILIFVINVTNALMLQRLASLKKTTPASEVTFVKISPISRPTTQSAFVINPVANIKIYQCMVDGQVEVVVEVVVELEELEASAD